MRNPPRTLPRAPVNDPKAALRLRWTILFLVLELTFEGLARKLNIAGTSIAIFLLKDVIVAAIGVQVLRMRRAPEINYLWVAYLAVVLLILPCAIQTTYQDTILAVFGTKEYLLYPFVAFGIYYAFENATTEEIVRFFRWIVLLVIPTTAVAILQLRLPSDHWLNLAVDGSNLDGFSAGGHLRVSSTFSFVAQYCAFIDAQVFIAMIALNSLKNVGAFWKLIYLSVVPMLILSSYVTGSRGAVLVCCIIVIIGAGLPMLKFQGGKTGRMLLIIGALLLTMGATRYFFPAAFEGYAEREQGQLLGASSEIQQRIYGSMFDWTSSISNTPFFGFGLGIMSNGSETISRYATSMRGESWTETDLATTLFEGGIYLVVVWYAFRLFVIFQAVRHFFAMKSEELSLPSAFCVGFIGITGLNGTLAIQPPIAIWFWLCVGTSVLLWKKSSEPKNGPAPPIDLPPPGASLSKKRGQSAYAERLHAQES